MRPLILLLLAGPHLWAAPPDVPKAVAARPGKLVRIVVKTDAEIGIARNFTDEEAFFGELVGPKGTRQFVFQAPDDGAKAEYVIAWWTKGETEGVVTTITTGVLPVVPPVKPGDPPVTTPTDPVKPPTTPAGYFFLVVRADGPADPKFTAAMGLPAWQELRKAGHKLKDKTVTEAAKDLDVTLPYGTQLPAVLTLVTDGKASRIVAGPVPLPTTDAGVSRLPSDVK